MKPSKQRGTGKNRRAEDKSRSYRKEERQRNAGRSVVFCFPQGFDLFSGAFCFNPAAGLKLFSDIQLLDQGLVARLVRPDQVIQKLAPFADHLDQTAA